MDRIEATLGRLHAFAAHPHYSRAMSLHQLRVTQRIPLTLDEAWAFFSDPRNLSVITPKSMGFVIKTEVPGTMYPGLLIAYTVRPLGPLPLPWVTEITHVRDREFFVDEQRSGPYRLWHHEHHFAAIPGGVEMRDIVSYALPFGPLGDLLNHLLVADRVKGIFTYREKVLEDRFGSYIPPPGMR
jgi:ligand-binding SRPBCC domain-containing protein